MKNIDDEILFKLVKEHFNRDYKESIDCFIYSATGWSQPAQWYRDFAKAVIAEAVVAEREACAKVCETFADRVFDTGFTPVEKEHPFSTIAGANQCAVDIRARAAIAAAKGDK